MRITSIELQNFRAFYGHYLIDLGKGKNLLVYGENGSGKSSLYTALREFLFGQDRALEPHRNIFVDDSAVALIRLSVLTAPRSPVEVLTWSDKGNGPGNRRTTLNQTDQRYIRDAARTSGFLEYKGLLETYFLQIKDDRVNIFHLLVNTLLKQIADARTGRTLQDDWKEICDWLPRRHAKNVRAEFQKSLRSFNERTARMLRDLESTTKEILKRFGYQVDLKFKFDGLVMEYAPEKRMLGDSIHLAVTYFDRPIERHHTFLNEAKLSALALAIYFAALLQTPHDKAKLNLLVLDDVLIGLDMSNRLPMLDILQEFFKDYQIIFLTYDRTWYEMVRTRLQGSEWKSIELFCSTKRNDEQDDQPKIAFELPLYAAHQSYIERARGYFVAHDYRGAIMYLRTAFETMLKDFCEKRSLKLRYRADPLYIAGELWDAVRGEKIDNSKDKFVDDPLAADVTIAMKYFLNTLSHANIVNVSRKEVEEVLQTMEKLEVLLSAAPKK